MESSKTTNRRVEDMNGKLAKRIRKAVNFNPNAVREYRRTNVGGGSSTLPTRRYPPATELSTKPLKLRYSQREEGGDSA